MQKKQARSGSAKNEWTRTLYFNFKKQARSASAKNEWERTLYFNLKKQSRSGSAKNECARTLDFNLKNEWARTLYFNLKKQFWGLAGFTMQYSTGIYSKKGGSSNWGQKMNFGLQEWRHRMESFLFLWQKNYNKIGRREMLFIWNQKYIKIQKVEKRILCCSCLLQAVTSPTRNGSSHTQTRSFRQASSQS